MSDLETYARTRDPQLRNELVVRHMPLAKFVARRMATKLPDHMDIDDLVSFGAIGLMDAIDKFDPGRGLKFSTYAVTRIRGEILDGLQRMEWAPKQVVSGVRRMRKVREELTNELGHEPSLEELAARLGVDEEALQGAMLDDQTGMVKSLVAEWEEGSLADALHDPLAEEQLVAGEVAELRHRVARALEFVRGDEARMLLMYYRDGMKLKEIAGTMGISSSSAIQAHTRMIDRLRAGLAAQG